MQNYHHIVAWQRAHALSIAVHHLAKGFTRAGFGNLRSQLTRAADSVPATIVEGCGASTIREFARFLDIAIKSANETEYHLLKARDHELLAEAEWNRLTAETIEIRKMIYGYRKKMLEKNAQATTPLKAGTK
ncbi:MAG TPA: four helix bundle protein [Gemmatimonadaceae bacterium]|jgi:four helix bundle protein